MQLGRCDVIANEKYNSFSKEWCGLEEVIRSGHYLGFGRKYNSMLANCLSEYGEKVCLFDKGVATAKQKELEEKLLQLVQPTFESVLRQIRSVTHDKFKEAFNEAVNGGKAFSVAAHDCSQLYMTEFDQQCEDAVIEQAIWGTSMSRAREKLQRDIDAHIDVVRAAELTKLSKSSKEKLNKAILPRLKALLVHVGDKTWREIRRLLLHETDSAVSELSIALYKFDIEEPRKIEMLNGLKDYARGLVEAKAKEECECILTHMKHRLVKLFSPDSNWMARNDGIPEIAKAARSSSLELLLVMAAIRLDNVEDDNIQKLPFISLMNNTAEMSVDPLLASTTWPEIEAKRTLITPARCKEIWIELLEWTKIKVDLALSEEARNKKSKNWEKVAWGGVGVALGAATVGVSGLVGAAAAAATGVEITEIAAATGAVAAAVIPAVVKVMRPNSS